MLLLASGVVSIIMGQFDDAFSITVVSNRVNSLIKLDLVSLTRNLAVCGHFYNSFFLSTIFIHLFIFILKSATLYKYSDIQEYPMRLAWFVQLAFNTPSSSIVDGFKIEQPVARKPE